MSRKLIKCVVAMLILGSTASYALSESKVLCPTVDLAFKKVLMQDGRYSISVEKAVIGGKPVYTVSTSSDVYDPNSDYLWSIGMNNISATGFDQAYEIGMKSISSAIQGETIYAETTPSSHLVCNYKDNEGNVVAIAATSAENKI